VIVCTVRMKPQKHLAPSLLLLYGDVEHTGYYDKLEHRYHIAAVLKYLWRNPDHRYAYTVYSQILYSIASVIVMCVT
jgi:Ubiquitin elongating factor core